ncbi:Thiamine-phosphate pyrophosphorylase [Aromatoleum aromaticum EbN1]|uniref:Thiamine-phosphate synthase n=1 Tax=Aromatoleum aromaticum (strain DSM 19018 / LMG 30748 / EbN1) TaxID=76114 RepID=THIE_AROAE|nr:thiamine phosphate synthase [Aromatoleum aromaticum]Q5P6J5.1 RecName: Full=Thiamine-phosphate synthase; Short=TP synthase; Short=TPS; AltName: Full=Thiamine-phosphate pyrophosphorylase; Short=TMP pyrophosphorylase; Short=TMP-PPase [Aromatoleum aromaticum EbN1]CAI07066.1 Thiamine-phosphate pyrophosphorylase [Aromatoleum aromaticum EbN1]
MPDTRLRGLYLITPDSPDTTTLVAQVERALRGQPALLQYRSKQRDAALRLGQARQIAALCREAGVPFIVNDSLELALATDADGVHLGREDGDLDAARRALGPGRILGVTCYNEWPRAVAGCAAGADYVAFGAVFPSATKPAAVRAPLELFVRGRRELDVPLAAIGGITLDNAAQVIAAGASLLAVVSDVFDAPDPGARAAAYRTLFDA